MNARQTPRPNKTHDQFLRAQVVQGFFVSLASVGVSVLIIAVAGQNWDPEIFLQSLVYAALIPAIVAPSAMIVVARLNLYNHRLLVELDRVANEDMLTGLLSRRAFFDRAATQLERWEHGAVMLADIDWFKAVNDTYGHSGGDAALKHVAEVMRRTAPGGGLIARMGGEEFVVLCEWKGLASLHEAAESVRAAIEAHPCWHEGHAIHLTVSIGISVGSPGDDVDALISRADVALYAAKADGRNRTQMAA